MPSSARFKQSFNIGLGVVSVLFALLWAVSIVFNPFSRLFYTDITVHNQTTEPLYLTPIGVSERGLTLPLNLVQYSFSVLPRIRSFDIRVMPGESRRIGFDWDDVQLAEILVKNESGEVRQLVADRNARKRVCCNVPSEREVSIRSWDDLSAPEYYVTEAYRNERVGLIQRIFEWIFILIPLFTPVYFILWWRGATRSTEASI